MPLTCSPVLDHTYRPTSPLDVSLTIYAADLSRKRDPATLINVARDLALNNVSTSRRLTPMLLTDMIIVTGCFQTLSLACYGFMAEVEAEPAPAPVLAWRNTEPLADFDDVHGRMAAQPATHQPLFPPADLRPSRSYYYDEGDAGRFDPYASRAAQPRAHSRPPAADPYAYPAPAYSRGHDDYGARAGPFYDPYGSAEGFDPLSGTWRAPGRASAGLSQSRVRDGIDNDAAMYGRRLPADHARRSSAYQQQSADMQLAARNGISGDYTPEVEAEPVERQRRRQLDVAHAVLKADMPLDESFASTSHTASHSRSRSRSHSLTRNPDALRHRRDTEADGAREEYREDRSLSAREQSGITPHGQDQPARERSPIRSKHSPPTEPTPQQSASAAPRYNSSHTPTHPAAGALPHTSARVSVSGEQRPGSEQSPPEKRAHQSSAEGSPGQGAQQSEAAPASAPTQIASTLPASALNAVAPAVTTAPRGTLLALTRTASEVVLSDGSVQDCDLDSAPSPSPTLERLSATPPRVAGFHSSRVAAATPNLKTDSPSTLSAATDECERPAAPPVPASKATPITSPITQQPREKGELWWPLATDPPLLPQLKRLAHLPLAHLLPSEPNKEQREVNAYLRWLQKLESMTEPSKKARILTSEILRKDMATLLPAAVATRLATAATGKTAERPAPLSTLKAAVGRELLGLLPTVELLLNIDDEPEDKTELTAACAVEAFQLLAAIVDVADGATASALAKRRRLLQRLAKAAVWLVPQQPAYMDRILHVLRALCMHTDVALALNTLQPAASPMQKVTAPTLLAQICDSLMGLAQPLSQQHRPPVALVDILAIVEWHATCADLSQATADLFAARDSTSAQQRTSKVMAVANNALGQLRRFCFVTVAMPFVSWHSESPGSGQGERARGRDEAPAQSWDSLPGVALSTPTDPQGSRVVHLDEILTAQKETAAGDSDKNASTLSATCSPDEQLPIDLCGQRAREVRCKGAVQAECGWCG